MLLVKAVLGAVNPADIATKRLSAACLESLSYFLGLWCGSNGNLVGAWDPARQQIRSLMGTLSALGMISQLRQLQGCVSNFSPTSLTAMDTVAADVQFEVKFLVTWLLMLVGYGVYMSWTLGCQMRNFVLAGDGEGRIAALAICEVHRPRREISCKWQCGQTGEVLPTQDSLTADDVISAPRYPN
eukprot:s707_g13.t1